MSSHEALRRELEESLTTEAFRPEFAEIDRLPSIEIARIMNGEDATVPAAVAARVQLIAAAIDGAAERMSAAAVSSTRAPAPQDGSACWTQASARPPSTPGRNR